MNDNDIIMLYNIISKNDIELTQEECNMVDRLSIIVEQIKLSHEYRDKLNELNKKLQGCDEDVK